MHLDLSTHTVRELLSLYASSIEELRARGVVRTANNPIGDYAEWLVAEALGLELTTNSAAGYDAVGPAGAKVQIKGRRITRRNSSRQLSAIRNLSARDFDTLVAVVFDETFEILEAVEIPHAVVGEFASYRSHVNAHILHASGKLLLDPRVRIIKSELCKIHNRASSFSKAIRNAREANGGDTTYSDHCLPRGGSVKHAYLEITYRKGRPFGAYYYLPRQARDTSVRTKRLAADLLVDFTADDRPIGIEISSPARFDLSAFNETLAKLGQPLVPAEEVAPLVAA